jgi:hypothetical protein
MTPTHRPTFSPTISLKPSVLLRHIPSLAPSHLNSPYPTFSSEPQGLETYSGAPVVASLAVSFVIIVLFTVYAARSTPFLNSELNNTDTVAHIAMSVSIFCSLMIVAKAGASESWEGFLNFTNVVCGAYFALAFLYEFPAIKLFIKNILGNITFSDSVTFAEGESLLPLARLRISLRDL